MKVLSLHASSTRGLPRPSVEEIDLRQNHGVIGDRKAGKSPNRQVLLVGVQTYDYLRENGLELPLGALGENIVLDFDPMVLPAQTQLEVGDALLELSLRCSPCAHLYDVWPQLRGIIAGRRGMLAKVLRDGKVGVRSAVMLNETPVTPKP